MSTDAADTETERAPRSRSVRGVLAALALIGLLLLTALGTAWWAARTASGSAWLLSLVPNLKVTGPRGALLGDFEAQAVSYRFFEK